MQAAVKAAFKEGGKKGVDLQVGRTWCRWDRSGFCVCVSRAPPPPPLPPGAADSAARTRAAIDRSIDRSIGNPSINPSLQGMAAMGGVAFYNLAVDTPNGDMELLEQVGAMGGGRQVVVVALARPGGISSG